MSDGSKIESLSPTFGVKSGSVAPPLSRAITCLPSVLFIFRTSIHLLVLSLSGRLTLQIFQSSRFLAILFASSSMENSPAARSSIKASCLLFARCTLTLALTLSAEGGLGI